MTRNTRPLPLPRPAVPTVAPGTPVWNPEQGDFT